MTEKRQIPHLLEEPPISVYPTLAKTFKNVNLAIVFQQLHFLLNVARMSKNKYVYVDGKWWVYNSYTEWQEHFPWLATVTIKGLFANLESKGLVISRQGVKDKFDRRKWYTIDYDSYLTYIQSMGQNLSDVHGIKNIPSESQNLSHDNRKSETTLSESTSERVRRARHPSKEKDTTSQDALIEAWAEVMGYIGDDIGATFTSKSNRLKAEEMLKWSIPATPEEIRQVVILKRRNGKDYAFAYLLSDIPELRAKNRLSTPTAPAQPFDLSEWHINEFNPEEMES